MNIPDAEDIEGEAEDGTDAQQPEETFQQPKCNNCGFNKFQFIGLDALENPIFHLLCLNCGLYVKLFFNPANKEITKSSPTYTG
jgi:hypothetical protein